jgi:SpoVK/Ycf46/Vps4 family AAA+-type ATPase
MNIHNDTLCALIQFGLRGDKKALIAHAKVAAAKAPPQLADRIERMINEAPSLTTLLIPGEITKLVREVQPWTSKSDVVWSDREQALYDSVIAEHAAKDLLMARGLPYRCRLLLHGPSGTGKTTFAAALAASLNLPLLEIPMDALVDSYLGVSSANIRKVLEWTVARPAIVLLDEIDAIATERGRHGDHAEQARMVTTLIAVLDQLRRGGLEQAILVATTNRVDALDVAIQRRFDTKHEFRPPSVADACKIWRRIFTRAGLEAPAAPAYLSNPAAIESAAIDVARSMLLEQAR